MEMRYAADPVRFTRMDSTELRENFLVEGLFEPGKVVMMCSFVDRVMVGSAVPTGKALKLEAGAEMACDYFAQRREIGIINIGGAGTITVDGTEYALDKKDSLYIGMGSKDVSFASSEAKSPAKFYIGSYPAHKEYPTKLSKIADAAQVHLGSNEAANDRTIFKHIHPDGIKSCQLVMGYTDLAVGNVWNTMPGHTHFRRMEVYMYFDVGDSLVFHYMGPPNETRHIAVRDGQAVISPSWSIHAGVGLENYSFVWLMGGENQVFDDMQGYTLDEVR